MSHMEMNNTAPCHDCQRNTSWWLCFVLPARLVCALCPDCGRARHIPPSIPTGRTTWEDVPQLTTGG